MQRVRLSGMAESMPLLSPTRRSAAQLSLSRIYSRSHSQFTGAAELLLILSHVEHRRVATLKQLGELFRLSVAEARLARALAAGLTPDEYADKHNISITTVRSHIKAALEKLEVRRMPDLVRIVLAIPAVR